jgi:hypothetical protein
MMKNDPFESLRPPPGCLSAWQLTRMARREAVEEEARCRTHVSSCPRCAARLTDESSRVAAMVAVPIPARVRAAGEVRPRFEAFWQVAGAVVPAAALLVLLVLNRDVAMQALQPVQLKGSGGALSVSVSRADATVVDDAPLEEIHDLRTGDKLHLRVVSAADRWIMVEGREGEHWASYFSGPRPADGWLPITVGIEGNSANVLRLSVCAMENDTPLTDDCEERTYRF